MALKVAALLEQPESGALVTGGCLVTGGTMAPLIRSLVATWFTVVGCTFMVTAVAWEVTREPGIVLLIPGISLLTAFAYVRAGVRGLPQIFLRTTGIGVVVILFEWLFQRLGRI